MPRLFTGIALPAIHRTSLTLLQSGLEKTRWIEPTDMHITLRFIGDVSPRIADEIAHELARKHWDAPTISFGELAHFGQGKPRSIYASIRADDGLAQLQKSQENLMQKLGLAPEGRKFTPHVTLGRMRGCSSYDMETWLASRALPQMPSFIPDSFALYSARESTGGGPYIVEQTYPLT